MPLSVRRHAARFKRAGFCVVAALGLALGNASAAPGATAQARPIVAAKVNPLPLFDKPGAHDPVKTTVPHGFPWPVLEDKEDFYRVKVEGQEYWVDSMHVRTTQAVKAKCTLGPGNKKQPVGATMGAGVNPCTPP